MSTFNCGVALTSYLAEKAAILGLASHAVTWRTDPTDEIDEFFRVCAAVCVEDAVGAGELTDTSEGAVVAREDGEDSVWMCFGAFGDGEREGSAVLLLLRLAFRT